MDLFRITSKKVLTLVCVVDKQNQKILLGYKKRGFGAHLWNGFGGKVEPGETPKEGALRELEEEAGITVRDEKMRKVGLLLFVFEGDPVGLETHVYSANEYDGEITECDEMRPQWFDFADIPYDQMWEDDRLWLPMVLQGQEPFFGKVFLLKRKPIAGDGDKQASPPVSSTAADASGAATNHSTTMTQTVFTNAQPKSGPFAMFKHTFEHSLKAAPREVDLDGNIASFD